MQTPTTVLVQKYEYLVTFQNAEYYFVRSEGRHTLSEATASLTQHVADGGHGRISRRHYGVTGMQYRDVKGTAQ